MLTFLPPTHSRSWEDEDKECLRERELGQAVDRWRGLSVSPRPLPVSPLSVGVDSAESLAATEQMPLEQVAGRSAYKRGFPLFSCITGTQEEEEVREAARSARRHAVHHRVPARGAGELAHQRRGAQEHGPGRESHEGRPRGHVSDPAVPRSHQRPRAGSWVTIRAGMGRPTLSRCFGVWEWNAPSEKGQKSECKNKQTNKRNVKT